jgi:SsrA-binding protein
MKKINRRAAFNYELMDSLEAGVVLSGAEARAVRSGHADITRAFVKNLGGELYLVNANIPVAGMKDYNATRTRKLLLHRAEIVSLTTKMHQDKLTLVPTKVYTKGRRVKLEVALARSKREYQKKESLKKKDVTRDIERELRGDKE